jgi:hypothetical protein
LIVITNHPLLAPGYKLLTTTSKPHCQSKSHKQIVLPPESERLQPESAGIEVSDLAAQADERKNFDIQSAANIKSRRTVRSRATREQCFVEAPVA